MDVSIVIPIFNSGHMVEDAVKRLTRVMKPLSLTYEILLRDDGSTDHTRHALQRVAYIYPPVRCFYNTSNRGLGETLRSLFADARGQNIIYCDCDLPFGANIISLLLEEIKRADVAVASRYRGAPNHVWLIRKIFSRLYHLFCKILFDVPVVDIGSGSVVINRQALSKLDLRAKRFDIHVELYVKAAEQGLRIKEISAETTGKIIGSFCLWRHGPQVVIDTIYLRWRLWRSSLLAKWTIGKKVKYG